MVHFTGIGSVHDGGECWLGVLPRDFEFYLNPRRSYYKLLQMG